LNKIYNTDVLVAFQNIPDEQFNLCVTDPPYKTITGGDSDGKNSTRPKGMLKGNRKLFKHQKMNISDWMSELFRVMKNETHTYIFTNSLNLSEMLIESEKAGFKLHNVLVWEKNNCTPSQFYMKNCEYVLFLRKGKAKWVNDIGGSKTVHKFNNVRNKLHPTQKPIELLEFYIRNSSQENDIVFDPFVGSGSTAIAAINTKRKYVGYELDDTYYEIACNRIKEHKLNQ
jgi:site-specific DNA-methyltransferase (adenine-specific)